MWNNHTFAQQNQIYKLSGNTDGRIGRVSVKYSPNFLEELSNQESLTLQGTSFEKQIEFATIPQCIEVTADTVPYYLLLFPPSSEDLYYPYANYLHK